MFLRIQFAVLPQATNVMKTRYSIFGEEAPVDPVVQDAEKLMWRTKVTWTECKLFESLMAGKMDALRTQAIAEISDVAETFNIPEGPRSNRLSSSTCSGLIARDCFKAAG